MPIAPPNLDAPTISEPAPELGLRAGPVDYPTIDLSGTRIERANYIARHWRGDLSLAVSYWINGWLFGTGYIVGTIIITDHPSPSITYAIGLLIVSALGFALQVWQLIGIWRSASKHTERGGRRIWAFLAQLGVILGWGNFVRGIFELLGLPGT
jgi:hypothetical protein